MDLDQKAQTKLQELQILEHNLQNILMQKQAYQLELNETLNALEEVNKTTDSIYKMAGSIMIKADKVKTISELEEKKKILQLRNNSLDKQESLFESKARELQEDLRKSLDKSQQKELKK